MTTSTPSCPTTNNGVPFGSQPGFPNGFVQNATPGYFPGAYGPTPGVPTGSPVNTANINEATPSNFVPGYFPGASPTNFYPTNFVNTWSWNTPFNYGFNTPFNPTWNTAFNTGWNTFQQPPFSGHTCPVTGATYTPSQFSNISGQPFGFGSWPVNTWSNAFSTPFAYQNAATSCCTPWSNTGTPNFVGTTNPFAFGPYNSGTPFTYGWNTPFNFGSGTPFAATPFNSTWTSPFWYQNSFQTTPTGYGYTPFTGPFNTGFNTPFNFGVPSFGFPTNTFAGVDLKDKCSPRGFGLIRDAA